MEVSVPQNAVNTEAAAAAAQAAITKATELGVKINVAVTDNGGHLMAFLRMPGAFLHSIDIAIDKAYTAAGFRFPTSQWQEILSAGTTLREGIQSRDRLVLSVAVFRFLLMMSALARVGVSGASEEEDSICAQAGINAVRAFANQ